jgi:diguanylate cyclase (GGDEF)-like protein/PAS domain S-box-containing protein
VRTLDLTSLLLLGTNLIFAIGFFGAWLRPKSQASIDDLAFSQIAVQHADDGLLVMDENGTIQWVNPAYCKLVGRDADEMVGRKPQSFALVPENALDRDAVDNFRFDISGQDAIGLETIKNRRKDGTIFWNQISRSDHTTASGQRYVVSVCRDVTQSIERERQLETTSRQLAHSATHDPLTKIANRSALTPFLEAALARANQADHAVGVLHVDLDKFKEINDNFGHPAGDAVLIAVARRIKNNIRQTDIVARVGGDEFVVVCQNIQRIEDLTNIGKKLLHDVNGPVAWRDHRLACKISIGAAISYDEGMDADLLLQQSDFALYQVKRAGRGGITTYDRAMHARQNFEHDLARDLRQAVAEHSLTFRFEPVLDASTGKICSVATQISWEHPEYGMLDPEVFLPIASSNTLLTQIENQTAQAAINFQERLAGLGHRGIKTSFKASLDSLTDGSLPDDMATALGQAKVAGNAMIVEIGRSRSLNNDACKDDLCSVVSRFHKMGIGIILDDPPHGLVSFLHLARLPIDGVKLKGDVIQGILDDAVTAEVIGATVTLCGALGLKITIDRVASQTQANALTKIGCDALQGSWVAPPMAEDELIIWLETRTDCPRAAPSLSRGELSA